ncbi:MAG: 6-carboxytetrahydropterin synthase [Sphingomonas sp.]|jgi:6-pyruvoyltetrahydropterin/6-carboxytetrahydropterin synthase|nr:6-carboxytetrahydropterin synthase [Sphingomonas sp.]
MHELCKQFRFDAAHTLQRDVEPASSRRIHGHSYRAEVAVRGRPAPDSGMLVDLGLLEQALANARQRLDHHFLDEVDGLGPATLENLAAWIWQQLEPHCPGLWRVTVARDSSGDSCSFFGGPEAA